jgi:hypothetical protein
MRGLDFLRPSQFLDQYFETVGKTVDIEIQGIVVAVGNAVVEGGVRCWNEPALRPHAGDDVKQRQPVVLRRGKARVGRLRVVARATAGGAAPRLDQLDVKE